MKKSYVFLYLFFLSTLSFSQPFIDIADVNYQRFTRVPAKDTTGIFSTTSVFRAGVTVPITTKTTTVYLLGFDHAHHHIDMDVEQDTVNYDNDLYFNALQLGMSRDMKNPKWSYVAMLVAKMNADYKSPVSSDFQLGGVVLFTWKYRENLKFKFGGYYNREYYGNYFMGLVGIEWKVNKRINIYGVIPSALDLEYRINKRLTCGLSYRSYNPTYRTKDNPGTSYVREGHPFWADNTIGAVVNYYPFKNITLYAGVGQTVFRYFQNYSENNIKIFSDPSLIPIKDQQFVYAGAAFRIRFDQKDL